MKITILYSDDNPADYHRLLLPAKFMNDPNVTIQLADHKSCRATEEKTFACDILFLSRIFIYDWATMEELKKKYGFKIVVDFDDYYKLLPQQLRYKLWQEYNVEARMKEAAAGADLLFVTNEKLYNVYKELNSNILIVPNALPFDEEPLIEKSDKIRFIYVAGASHYNDLKLLNGLFQRLRSDGQFKAKATFTFCGYNKNIPVCDKMESICKINGSYMRRDIMSLNNYMDHYNYGDVSIAPLENNFFNNCKSNLKFIETASMKLPFICSEVPPYNTDMELKDRGIIFCNNTHEWYHAFKFFMNNPNAVQDYGMVNYQYAKERYNLKDAIKLRVQTFEFIAG